MGRREKRRQLEQTASEDTRDHMWDQKLHIETAQETDEIPHAVNFRYEPTPYSVLERLAESGCINSGSFLLDYGCGKGRCPIFLHAMTGCRAVGIDYDPAMIGCAKANLAQSEMTEMPARRSPEKGTISFRCAKAQNYAVKNEDTFYFFNPFSEVILEAVLRNILSSWYENPRSMRLFFYYPKDEDIALLCRFDEIRFLGEIDCRDLFEGRDDRERILIYEIPEKRQL